MRATEFLIEAFNSPYPFSWIETPSHGGRVEAMFASENQSYIFRFVPFGEEDGIYDVDFSTEDSMSFGLTGDGNAFRVMATAMSIIPQGIKRLRDKGFEVNTIIFAAEKQDYDGSDTGRAALYKRMVQKYASQIGDAEVHDVGGQLAFEIDV